MKTKSNNKTKVIDIEIANIKEDPFEHQPNNKALDAPQPLTKSIELMHRLLYKEVVACAQQIGIDAEELQAWIDCQIEVPHQTLLCLLRRANQYSLDPLKEEIFLTQYQEEWQAIISIDGWIKILHQHPAFTGISFTQSPESQNLSETWIECTIHRSDEVMPTTIREYLSEVQNESEIWKKMPRRMLRHRALQQCARLALGIAGDNVNLTQENGDSGAQTPSRKDAMFDQTNPKTAQSEKLKSLLASTGASAHAPRVAL